MISLFELLKIGVGPSSSHTVGPMLAGLRFARALLDMDATASVARIQIDLYGSLALTGVGHRTDRAVIAGLSGAHPTSVIPESIDPLFEEVSQTHQLRWLDRFPIAFDFTTDLLFHRDEFLIQHPNGLRFTAYNSHQQPLLSRAYFSIGGGFVVDEAELAGNQANAMQAAPVRFPFESADQLLHICETENMSVAQVVHANELSFHGPAEIEAGLDLIWATMRECIAAGCQHQGILPGGLNIPRRAPGIFEKLNANPHSELTGCLTDPLMHMDWVTLFALAVNEENAAGGRVVTAPTNGAAGVIPAVLCYFDRFVSTAKQYQAAARQSAIHEFLKTASAIGMLYKRNASLSAAEMGCQGEVGVACSMAAGGLAAVMGGTPRQIENAAEIGMEHNLGLTCDPVAGLVQVPCIERNAMGAVKAINAARLAVLYGDGRHRVSLDKVIETMRQTGVDMQSKYKETSLGGLALNVVNC